MESTQLVFQMYLANVPSTLGTHPVGSLRRNLLPKPPIEQLQFPETTHSKSLQIPLCLTKPSMGFHWAVTRLSLSCGLKGGKEEGKTFLQRRNDGYYLRKAWWDRVYEKHATTVETKWIFVNRSPSLRRWFLGFQSKTKEHSHGIFSAKKWMGAQ